MKATGVVRRIDDLGRIVIPKEIRKVLRIKEGDPIEIFTGREGEVILKKYSPIGELSQFAGEYAESLSQTTGYLVIITDCNKNNDIAIPITKNDNQERKFNAQVIYPIISQGDVIGSVVLISKDSKNKMTETEEKVAQSAAGFLSSQMEI